LFAKAILNVLIILSCEVCQIRISKFIIFFYKFYLDYSILDNFRTNLIQVSVRTLTKDHWNWAELPPFLSKRKEFSCIIYWKSLSLWPAYCSGNNSRAIWSSFDLNWLHNRLLRSKLNGGPLGIKHWVHMYNI